MRDMATMSEQYRATALLRSGSFFTTLRFTSRTRDIKATFPLASPINTSR
uniref:Uncharacterized protein n=1 Tax=Picea sitchensis TaxID=3332 RepID=A9NME2_PICSI|nr:unknown [Picea sitchensis]